MKETGKYAPTPEDVEAWKEKHGKVFQIEVESNGETFNCFLRQPTRQELGLAAKLAMSNPLQYNESILKACWLGGDEAIKTDNGLFLSAGEQLGKLVTVPSHLPPQPQVGFQISFY